MGNSLNDYRCRIGTFLNNRSRIKVRKCKHEARNSNSGYLIIRPVFLLILSVLINQTALDNSIYFKQSQHSIIPAGRSDILHHYSEEILNNNFEAKYKYGNKQKNGLKIMHWNAGGKHLVNKIQNIDSVINGYKPSFLGISEANLLKKHDLNDVQIENYQLFLSNTINNPNINASRVVVYVHDGIHCKVRHDLMNDKFSSIWLEVSLPRQKKFLVCHAYRDWQYLKQEDDESKSINAQLERWEQFLDQWEAALETDMECIVLGDLNIDHTKWTRKDLDQNCITKKLKPLIVSLFERILPYGMVQCTKGPTRFESNSTPSGLDHFWTSNPNKLSDVHSYFQGSSDHKLITGTRYTKSIVRNSRYVKKRSYKNFSPQLFIQAVRQISWWELYSCDDADEAVSIFTQKLTNILDEMAPIKKYQIHPKYAPWLSESTKELMKERDLSQKKAAKSGKNDDWKDFKKLRNNVNGILKKEKINWQSDRLENCSTTSDTWRMVKNWLGWNKGGSPSQLVINGELKSKPKELANCMNEFFVRKVDDLRRKIPACRESPLEKVKELMKGRKCSFKIQAVHPEVVSDIIKKLKNSKSCGLDNIDSYILKLACDELTPGITHIVNLSISGSHFPTPWKNSKVIPLFKKEDATIPKNYRPVSLLPILSKILERAVYNQLIKYLEDNQLLHPSHHGFRKSHNTTTALLEMYANWVEAAEQDKITAVVMLDLSAAFDLVDKEILIEKLKLYGLEESSASWMNSYLSERNQQVYLDGELSKSLPVNIGVPQGSILGPILYCILVNDLPELAHNHDAAEQSPTLWNTNCISCGGISCFADDSTMSISGVDPDLLTRKLEEKYKLITEYMASNRLVLNTDKTHLLVMTSKKKHQRHGDYGIFLDTGSEIISPQDHEKLLGCIISSDFTWNDHLVNNESSLQRQLTSRINALRKISHSASFETRKMIANGIVMSRIIYVMQVWGGTKDYLIKTLQILQNKAARFVTKLDIYTSQKKLLLQCGWLSVRQLVEYHSLVLIFKSNLEKKPVFLQKYLTKTFTYRTRAASTGCIVANQKTTKDISKESFIIKSTKMWNVLPPQIKQATTMQEFKRTLRAWIRINVPQ